MKKYPELHRREFEQFLEQFCMTGSLNKTIREMSKLSDEGALKELKRLLALGVIKSEGRGRSIRYLLA